MDKPCQLQINQSGSWRRAIDFDANGMPDEFLEHLDAVARLCGRLHMRIVISRTDGNGRSVATHDVLKHWDRSNGWTANGA